jgi:hypothetical protein
MGVSVLYPEIDFTQVDYSKIPLNAYLVGFDVRNPGILSKMDSFGNLEEIGLAKPLFQENLPRNPRLGTLWFDTKICETFVYLFDGKNNIWVSVSNVTEEDFSKIQGRNFNFPEKPKVNEKFKPYPESKISYIWTGYAWKAQTNLYNKSFYFQEIEPDGFIDEGVFWYKTDELIMYVRAYDGKNYHWIQT